MKILLALIMVAAPSSMAASEQTPDLMEYISNFKQEVVSEGIIITDPQFPGFFPEGGSTIRSIYTLSRDEYSLVQPCTRDNQVTDVGTCHAKIKAELTIKDGQPHLLIYEVTELRFEQ